MENIERFNEITAQIFARLYERFPMKAELSYSTLAGISDAELMEDFPLNVPEGVHIAAAAVSWLHDAGYIWADDRQQLHATARLSPKGLQVLNCVPSALEESEPIGERLRTAVQKGAGDLAKDLVKEALLASFRFATS